MKLEWKKAEKALYLPPAKPVLVEVPVFRFFVISGKGNPNEPFFGEYVSVLYSLSYAIRMSPKSGMAPDGYQEYTVYPLEGVWDLSQAGVSKLGTALDKNELIFDLMIRQPDFVEPAYAARILETVKHKKPHRLLDQVRFESMKEGSCVQMMHIGSYDSESASFQKMEAFAKDNGWKREGHKHREIYLSDPGKTAPEKLKTVLRFPVSKG